MRIGSKPKIIFILVFTILALLGAGLYRPTAKNNSEPAIIDRQDPVASGHKVEGQILTAKTTTEQRIPKVQDPNELTISTQHSGFNSALSFVQQQLSEQEEQRYIEGERFWKEQLQLYPDNLITIMNAAKFFMRGNLDLGISTFKLGKSLDPGNDAEWDRELGNAYMLLNNRAEADDTYFAREGLNTFENAYSKETSLEKKSEALIKMAKAALAAGELEKAVNYANQMLSSVDDFSKGLNGDLIYNGNYILGMVAVKKSDLAGAEQYLLLSGDTPGSAVLSSFGPNMSLAQEMLDRGERDTVLTFLHKCQKFWISNTSPCSLWIKEIEEGGIPNFIGHFNY